MPQTAPARASAQNAAANTPEAAKHPAIYAAMAAIMAEIGPISKEKTNAQQGFKFRGIDDVYNHVCDVMARNGVFSVPTVLDDRTEERQTKNGGNLIYRILKIKYTFYAVDGSSVDAVVLGEGMDSGDKASNKAMSIGHKYSLIQAFCIMTADLEDPDKTTHEVTPKTAKKPETRYEPIDEPAPKTATVYTGTSDQQTIVKGLLRAQQVPEQYWEEIHQRLMGRPSTALKGVISDVRAGL